ncbi:P-loop NTPase fold protein [Streptomyces sp. GESEQ-35]|uniref:P-loop NTPase fold protein n=1 Tax=Streptomyces sp. GESEQ-35 TaxID=2812657 RepID=UPI001B334E13|nr:P-loop NTPase fold protein [Streptomyces sp. GESEQ-35]
MEQRMPRRAILIAGSHFGGSGEENSGSYPPLPFAPKRAAELADRLSEFDFDCSLLADRTSREMDTTVRKAIRDAEPEDVLVVHVISHSALDRSGRLLVIGAEGDEAGAATVEDWIAEAADRAAGPQVLFLLDVSHAGSVTRRSTQFLRTTSEADIEHVWIIGASDADEMAFDGLFTQATARTLRSISTDAHNVDPSVRYVPLTLVAREIQHQLGTQQKDLPQTLVTSLINPLNQPEFPFFPNPRYQPSASPIPAMEDAGRTWCLSVYDTHGVPSVALGGDDSLRVFDLQTGLPRATVRTDSVFAVAPVPGSDSLVCAGKSNAVEVRSSVDLSVERVLWRHAAQVNDLAVGSVEGRWMVCSASDDGSIRGGDTEGVIQIDIPTAHQGFANAVAVAGPLVISAGADGDVAAWDYATGEQKWRQSMHTGPVHKLAVAAVGGREVVVSAGEDGTLRVWATADGTLFRTLSARPTPIRALSVLLGRPLVAVGGPGGTMDIWDVGAGTKLLEVTSSGPDVCSLAFAEMNGQNLLLIGDTQGLRPWPLGDFNSAPQAATQTQTPTAPHTDAPAAFHAGYAADVAEGEDRLGISREVDTLCQLIMAREVRPPMSIGLFGDWGTGKSFFMAQMRQRIKELARRSKQAELEQVGSGLCSGVCEVEFNAWHYLDANLWASVASAIFDRLALTDTDTRATLRDLPSARVLGQELKDKKRSLEAQLGKTTEDLARNEPVDLRSLLTVDSLKQVQDVVAPSVLEQADKALTDAGISATQVGKVKLQAMESADSLQRLWLLLSRGNWPVRLALGAAIAVFVLLGPALIYMLRNVLGTSIAAISSMLGTAILATAIATPYLRRLKQALKVAEDAVNEVDRQRRIPMQARQEALQRRIARIEEQTAAIDASIRDLEQESSIRAYALKRLDDDDYRRHEGLMALLRRDLQELSRRLTAQNTSPLSATTDLERIVLYIDDLDRCPPPRVVEVLQAIQLLLAFPLFVVVVGVDAQWLLRSVHAHYRDVLGSDSVPTAVEDTQHWASTPQNYLEKIFQIPLCLPPMSSAGYTRLVGADLHEPLPSVPEEAAAVATEQQPVTTRQTAPQPSQPPPTARPSATVAAPGTPRVVARELHRYQDTGPVAALGLTDDRPLIVSVDSAAVLTHRNLRANGVPHLTQKITGGELMTVTFTPEGNVLLTGEFEDAVALVADERGTILSRVSAPDPPLPTTPSVLFSEDGSEVALTWHEAGGTPAGHVQDRVMGEVVELDITAPQAGALLAWTGSWRLLADADGVRLSRTAGGSFEVSPDPGRIERTVMDPLGRRLALIGTETLLGLWDTAGTPGPITPSQVLPPVLATARIALSADGLIAVAEDTRVRVWEVTSGTLRAQLEATSAVTALAFSPSGRRLATGAQDGTVQVWAIENPDPEAALKLEALRLTRAEHDMIMSVGPLIATPRTARRLVNTYRLLRTCLNETDIERVRSGDHKPLILLLAVLIGYPAQGAVVLETLLDAGTGALPGDFTALLRRVHTREQPARQEQPSEHSQYIWSRLASVTERVVAETGASDAASEYQHWATYVARFSFRTGHLQPRADGGERS